MNNYAIISEFNPFHKGHKFLIDSCKENGATHITAIMSGNFVQRGDVAIISKKHRTEMALKNGVDLVIELPLPYAVSNAQTFARGGISIVDNMGCVNHLAFASECGEIEVLKKIAGVTASLEFENHFKNEISKGISYPTALSNAVGNLDVNLRDVISSPNNVLGIEYIKALNEINSSIIPFTIKRKGDSHNSKEIFSEFASASNIRKLLAIKTDVTNYIPENCADIIKNAVNNREIATLDNNMRGVILKLRNMTVDDIADVADVNEGLEHRLHNAINASCSIDEIIENTKSKRYTYARIRRFIISCLLDITKEYTIQKPDYIRVLGFTKKGAEILNAIKQASSVPIITKLTNLPKNTSSNARKLLELEVKATDLYYTFTESLNVCGTEYKNGLVIIK